MLISYDHASAWLTISITFLTLLWMVLADSSDTLALNRTALKEKTTEMFYHAFDSYMKYAYPADELMPLSCSGRFKGVTPCRGDVDDGLGNGLLSAHILSLEMQSKLGLMQWYDEQLLEMAQDIASRLLPAFNTTTGLPFPRVNLKRGLTRSLRLQQDTCTACGGSMILEFGALSRLTGDPVFEEKAGRAMNFLWKQRQRSNDLMGTVLNIHSGDWIRKDSGVGAGIDSYYEYCLKAYILLGDESFLHRFNKHYAGIMRYVNQGPMLVDVHMHRPDVSSRGFMDALLAFWPGLQVLKGDLKPAIEIHEMLYQVIKRHKFIPEAFTHDLQVHWCQHHLRPEFIESTYFLYKATGDPHYLEVGKEVLDSLNQHSRVRCGFAAVKDVRTLAKEDRMDSYVLAETFKYLYLLFAEPEDIFINLDDFVFTTEAHLLPLHISRPSQMATGRSISSPDPRTRAHHAEDHLPHSYSCPNLKKKLTLIAPKLRQKVRNRIARITRQNMDDESGPVAKPVTQHQGPRLRAADFNAANVNHMKALQDMGISVVTMADGRMQLAHSTSAAKSQRAAQDGLLFMKEMIELSKILEAQVPQSPRVVQILTQPFLGNVMFSAFPAQFGHDFSQHLPTDVVGHAVVTSPLNACTKVHSDVAGRIAVVKRGDCMFVEKVRHAQEAGAMGVVVVDNVEGTSSDNSPSFAMSGDGTTDVHIPSVFLFGKEGQVLLLLMREMPRLIIRLAEHTANPDRYITAYLTNPRYFSGENLPESSHGDVQSPDGDSNNSNDASSLPDLIEIRYLSNGQRQLKFNFDHFLKSIGEENDLEGRPGSPGAALSDTAEFLMETILLRTNLGDLPAFELYARALKKLIYLSLGDRLPLSTAEEDLLVSLAGHLQLDGNVKLPPPPPLDSLVQRQSSCGGELHRKIAAHLSPSPADADARKYDSLELAPSYQQFDSRNTWDYYLQDACKKPTLLDIFRMRRRS